MSTLIPTERGEALRITPGNVLIRLTLYCFFFFFSLASPGVLTYKLATKRPRTRSRIDEGKIPRHQLSFDAFVFSLLTFLRLYQTAETLSIAARVTCNGVIANGALSPKTQRRFEITRSKGENKKKEGLGYRIKDRDQTLSMIPNRSCRIHGSRILCEEPEEEKKKVNSALCFYEDYYYSVP